MFSTVLHGEPMSLENLLRRTGALLRWDSIGRIGQLSLGDNTVVFRPDDPWMVLNGNKLLDTGSVIEENGRLIFSEEAAVSLFDIFGISANPPRYRLSTILIDPGHGGRDSGALRQWNVDGQEILLLEKDVVLDISLRLAEALRRQYPDKEILLTRNSDVYPTLEERVKLANSVELKPREGMIYLSIHVNASLGAKAEGYEVWFLPKEYRRNVIDRTRHGNSQDIAAIVNALWEEEFTHESVRLADMILESFSNLLGPDVPNRGRREESWFVVRNAKMASVLLEVGFLTNRYEAERLRSPEYLSRISMAIYNGIKEFVEYFEDRDD